MSNVRQIGLAVQMYASDNRDFVPMHPTGGNWAWDVRTETANVLINGEASTTTPDTQKRRILYCPGSMASVKWDNKALWNRGGNAILGYGWLGQRSDQTDRVNGTASLKGGKRFVTKTTAVVTNTVSETELVVDATPSGGPAPSTGKNDFLHAPNTSMGMKEYSHSGHLQGRNPSGGNILFLDGHASWRRFRDLGPWYDTGDRGVSQMRALVRRPSIYCKLSGLVEGTARNDGSAPRDVEFYRPVLDAMRAIFGPERLIYASNWPVSERFAPLATVQGIVGDYFRSLGRRAEEKVFAQSAKAAYPHCRCLSTAGARPTPHWLQSLLDQGHPIYCGFDADPTGEHMAAAMILPGHARFLDGFSGDFAKRFLAIEIGPDDAGVA